MVSRDNALLSDLESVRPPTNLYSPEYPCTVTVVSKRNLNTTPRKTYHVVFDHQGFLPHWEGQQFGVMLAPDQNPFEPGNAKKLLCFSVASTRYGDSSNGKTASLCVPYFPGTLSSEICNSSPGRKFQFTGPYSGAMLLGDYGTNSTHIFVPTGAAIAPFRAHILRFFDENRPNFKFRGLALLFSAAAKKDNLLYDEDFKSCLSRSPEHFKYEVQDDGEDISRLVNKHAAEIFDHLEKEAYIYFSGIRGMETPIKKALEDVARQRNLNWDEVFGKWKNKSQWRVEVQAEQPPLLAAD